MSFKFAEMDFERFELVDNIFQVLNFFTAYFGKVSMLIE